MDVRILEGAHSLVLPNQILLILAFSFIPGLEEDRRSKNFVKEFNVQKMLSDRLMKERKERKVEIPLMFNPK